MNDINKKNERSMTNDYFKFLFFSLYEDTRLNIKYEYARFLYKI